MLARLQALHKKYIPQPEPIVRVLDNLALVLYALFIFEAFLRTTTFVIDWHPYYHLSLKVILILLVVVKSFLKVFDDLWVYILLFICAIGYALTYLQGNHGILLEIILFTVLLKDIDFRKIAKVFFVVIGISLVCIFVASKRGMLTNLTYYSDRGPWRQSFGINYPTDFAAYILYLSLVWVFIRNVKISFVEIVLMGLLTRWTWINCSARASTICMVLLIVAALVCKMAHIICGSVEGRRSNRVTLDEDTGCSKTAVKRKNSGVLYAGWKLIKGICNVVTWLVTLAVPVCFGFSVLTAYKFDITNSIFNKLNILLSDRLRLGKMTFDTYDIKLFGQEIEMHGNGGTTLPWLNYATTGTGYNFIDCSYLNIMFRYGLFVVICTVLLLWITSILAKKRKDYITLFIIAIVAVHSIIEHHMLDLHYNPFIFMLFSGYFSKAKDSRKEKLGRAVEDNSYEMGRNTVDAEDGEVVKKQKKNNSANAGLQLKKALVILGIYMLLSGLMFLLDKREPEHIVYDIACPVEEADDRNDTPAEEITPLVDYMEYDGQYKLYRQNFYTPKRITGIELWLECDDRVSQSYAIQVYNQAGEVMYTHTLYSEDIDNGDFTRIIFKDFYIESGALCFFCVVAEDYVASTLKVGVLPRTSLWANYMYVNEVHVEGNVICFNLIYDYQGWGFINWMALTVGVVLIFLGEKKM